MAQRQVIAIVDDDALIRDALKDLLDSAGYTSVAFSSARGVLKSKHLASFACLITDMRMPGTTGRDPLLPAEAGHVRCAVRLRG
jgi:FixJ family two-component response regulator